MFRFDHKDCSESSPQFSLTVLDTWRSNNIKINVFILPLAWRLITLSHRVVLTEPTGHPVQGENWNWNWELELGTVGPSLAQCLLLPPLLLLVAVLVLLWLPGPLPLTLETLQVEEQYFPTGAGPHQVPAGRQGRAGLHQAGRLRLLPLLLLGRTGLTWS